MLFTAYEAIMLGFSTSGKYGAMQNFESLFIAWLETNFLKCPLSTENSVGIFIYSIWYLKLQAKANQCSKVDE